jgi:hypothetical protein
MRVKGLLDYWIVAVTVHEIPISTFQTRKFNPCIFPSFNPIFEIMLFEYCLELLILIINPEIH